MKKILVCMALLVLALNSFSQHADHGQILNREDYLKKSRNQSTAAWILLGGGVALTGAGIIISNQSEVSFENAATGVVLAGIGVLSVVGSVKLFISSGRNKRKAMKATAWFDTRQYPTGMKTGFVFRSSPVLSMKINF